MTKNRDFDATAAVGAEAVLSRQHPTRLKQMEKAEKVVAAWEMYVHEGLTQAEIARRLGVTRRVVGFWLREAQNSVIQQSTDVVAALMLEITTELQRTIRQIDSAIEKTLEGETEEVEETSDGAARTMNYSRKQTIRRSPRPDAKLFSAKIKALDELASLWGIGKEEKSSGEGAVIQSITVQRAVISPEWAKEMVEAGFSVDVVDGAVIDGGDDSDNNGGGDSAEVAGDNGE